MSKIENSTIRTSTWTEKRQLGIFWICTYPFFKKCKRFILDGKNTESYTATFCERGNTGEFEQNSIKWIF